MIYAKRIASDSLSFFFGAFLVYDPHGCFFNLFNHPFLSPPGRLQILIYEVLEVVPEPGQPLTKNKLKVCACIAVDWAFSHYGPSPFVNSFLFSFGVQLLSNTDQRGAITCLSDVSGYLIGCIGQSNGAKVFEYI